MGDILQGKSHIQSHRTTSKSNGTASPNSSNISTRELHSPLNDFDIKAEKELIDFKKQIKADITEIDKKWQELGQVDVQAKTQNAINKFACLEFEILHIRSV